MANESKTTVQGNGAAAPQTARVARMPGRMGMRGMPPAKGMKLNPETAKRLFGYIAGQDKAAFAVVVVCILISTAANVAGSMFLRILIDRYIEPLLLSADPVFDGLVGAILTMACVYLAGVSCTFTYNWLMAGIFYKAAYLQ